MRKHFSLRVVFLAGVSALAVFATSSAWAGSSQSSWIADNLNIKQQAQTKSAPSSLAGNIDCAMQGVSLCAVSTVYGMGASNGTVRLNSGADFYPVRSYLENRPRFLPIPNSNEFITYTTEPVTGFYLYFNYNFNASVNFANDYLGKHYQVVAPPDGKLVDKTNHRLAADSGSMSFSENGEWMIVSDPNVAVLRVNLRTFEVLPFASGFDYSIGLDPSLKTAVTNDGRYAAVYSKNFSRFELYDLDSCAAVPSAITGPVNCDHRNLQTFMNQQVAGYNLTSYVRFLNDDTLSLYASSAINGSNVTHRYLISPSEIADQLDYLALGDSYISGEGAFDYFPGTDEPNNTCHLSALSYPFLIGRDLNYNSYHSVACSGAVANDIVDVSPDYKGQVDDVIRSKRSDEEIGKIYASFKPGYVNQVDFVNQYQPKAITVSISGNDVGMISKLKSCIAPGTCFQTYEERESVVQDINNTFPKLVDTYQKLKAAGPPDMRIYVIGYPQIAKPGGDCALNVHLNNDEVIFTTQAIDYLDSVIKAAAAKAGVYYADTEDALYGHRFCEAGPGSVAMNGVTAGNDIPGRLNGPLGNESYHPNPFGYELMENKILQVTHNLTDPMPAADPNSDIPSPDVSGILDAPKSGETVKQTEYDPTITDDTAYQQIPILISVNGADHSLAPSTTLQAEIHSTPYSLGQFITDENGNLSVQMTLPSSVPAGYHTLHFFGTDLTGQAIDIYKDIYVAESSSDFDSDGVPNSQQTCIGVEPSGVDYDQDGIDDSCDPNISLPPAPQSAPAASSVSDAPTPLPVVLPIVASSAAVPVGAAAASQSDDGDTNRTSPSAPAAKPKVLSASTTKKPAAVSDTSYHWPLGWILAWLGITLAAGLALSLV